MNSELHISDHTVTVTERSSFLVRPGLKTVFPDPDDLEEQQPDLDLEHNNNSSKEVAVLPCPSSERRGWRRFLGLLLTVVHVLAFSSNALVVKFLDGYHPFSLAVWRFQGILLPSLAILVFSTFVQGRKETRTSKGTLRKPILSSIWPVTKDGNWKTILLICGRGFLGSCAVALFFYSLKYISIADTLVIQAAAPVFINLLAYFILGEPCGIFPVFLAVLSIVGVTIISRPPILTGADGFDRNTLIGCSFSFAGMCCSVMVFVLIRYLKGVHYAIITISFGIWGTCQSLLGALIIGVFHFPIGLEDILLTTALAVLTFVAQISVTLALQHEEAGPVSLIRTLNCVVGFGLQKIFLDIPVDLLSLIGASLVMVGVVFTVFKKQLITLPKTHRLRRVFFFVLK